MEELRRKLALQGQPSSQQLGQALQEGLPPVLGRPQLGQLVELGLPLARLVHRVPAVHLLPLQVPAVQHLPQRVPAVQRLPQQAAVQ